jgi:hypothetical protein
MIADREVIGKMRRECRRLLDEADKTENHEERGSILRRALELASAAEVEERKLLSRSPEQSAAGRNGSCWGVEIPVAPLLSSVSGVT